MPSNKEKILDFIKKSRVRKIPGIGPRSESILKNLGIETCENLLNNLLIVHFGFTELSFNFFLRSSLGISRAHHCEPGERKSMSVSETIPTTDNEKLLLKKIKELAKEISSELEKEEVLGQTITLTIKTHKFQQT